MKSVLLVGAGQLGSRYLQSMTQRLEDTEFVVVEPNAAARATARERYAQVVSRPGNTLTFVADLKTYARKFNAAIIATTSSNRLEVMREILRYLQVEKIVLEKVLFQNRPSFYEAKELLEASHVRAWVNCPRRSFDIYKEVNAFFGEDVPRRIEVSGGGWGLACNGIHFMDLASYLFGEIPTGAEGKGLKAGSIPSKRPGYLEVEGTMLVDYGSDRGLSLSCISASIAGIVVVIRGNSKTAIIDETGGTVLFKEPADPWRQESFRIPPLSEYAGAMVERIIEEGQADIPSYEESMKIHLPFIDALCRHWGVDKCNIT